MPNSERQTPGILGRVMAGIASVQLGVWVVVGGLVLLGGTGLVWQQWEDIFAASKAATDQRTSDLAACDTRPPPTRELDVGQIELIMIFISQERQRQAAEDLKKEISRIGRVSINIFGPDDTYTDVPENMIEVRFFDQANIDNACRISVLAEGMESESSTFLLAPGDAPRQLEVWFPSN